MIQLSDYLSSIPPTITSCEEPWLIPAQIPSMISNLIKNLTSDEYIINNGNAVHRTAMIEPGAILKSPYIIGPNCFIASYAYLSGGVWLDSDVIIGPACEIKSSLILKGSKAAHFNFIGDSVIGKNVNIEAGAIIANYRNELACKEIVFFIDKKKITTGVDKFGAILGDECKIGANAVLAPGTLLKPQTIVGRLALIDSKE
jgi:bifunctional N-acetylglucosamine-1-phosphate-uridyltransferase/glucosamine-1-phosphate-acetyltransferase GlmU-like protein